MKRLYCIVSLLLTLTAAAYADVAVTSPTNGQTVSSSVQYLATATTNTCSSGVASMGVYVDNHLTYVSNGSHLNTSINLSPGTYHTVVEEWDYCGGATYTPANITVSTQAGVHVASPANNAAVNPTVSYVATATSSCSQGVAAMGVYVNNQLKYVGPGGSLNTQLTLSTGTQQTVVEEWDYCGGASYTPVNVTVQGVGTTVSNLQASQGWVGYGELAPSYNTCSSNCPGVNWSMSQGRSSPSVSGDSTQFNLGGTTPYADALWTLPVLGQNSSQKVFDTSHSLLPTIHNFIYDAYVFVTNAGATQNLEFDISMYMNGSGMIWGTQCDHLADGDWDIWDNTSAQWVSTGAPCNFINNGWNHVTVQVQRQADNTLLYQTITMNGVTANINRTFAPYSVSSSWWGVTVNYQMDGNYQQASNTTYLDNFSLTYW
jgi:hypothetical protein